MLRINSNVSLILWFSQKCLEQVISLFVSKHDPQCHGWHDWKLIISLESLRRWRPLFCSHCYYWYDRWTTRKHLLAKFIVVHWHECFPLYVAELDRSKMRFGNTELFLTNTWFQVMPCASPSVTIEQLRATLEPGITVIGLVCSHTNEEQEDFNSHFMSVADRASVQWR